MRETNSALVDLLAEMTVFLREALEHVDDSLAARQPTCDKDAIISQLCHLVDCERELYGERLERLLTESHPALAGLDVSNWPIDREYSSRSLAETRRNFERARFRTVDQLRELGAEEWNRSGARYTGDHCDVKEIVIDMIEHDLDHRKRIARVLAEFSIR